MRLPLSLDLRKATLEADPGADLAVLDADGVVVFRVVGDSEGSFDHGIDLVEVFNERFNALPTRRP